MKLKLFTSTILISLFLAVPNYAQEQEINLRELYNLCSKFPSNTRCQGRNIPILLAERTGYEGECSFLFVQPTKLSPCKFTLNEQVITLYVEVGEPIEFLDQKRGTVEINISFSNIFAHTTKSWRFREGSNQSNQSEFAEVDIGFMTEANTNSSNRSNFLRILTNPTLGMSFARRLIPITAFAAKTGSFQNQLVTQTETLATPVDKTAVVRQLLQTKACIRCDLREANLQSANLENANLEGANLENANLAGAKLDGVYLVGANLNGANLTKADMEGARLALSSLVKANLAQAKLRGANLQSSNLEAAILRSANLNADDKKGTDLKYANLKQADLSEAQLQGADLSLANLEAANLTSANLSDTTTRVGFFSTPVRYNHVTLLIGANLRRANLSNANLEQASLFKANLSNASLTSTRLKNADMRDVNLSGADLNNANLEGTNLCGAIMPDGKNSGC